MTPRTRTHGFGLLQLLIAIAIVGILAGLAFPGYAEQTRRAARSNAFTTLIDYGNLLERTYLTDNSYGATTCKAALPPTTDAFSFACASDIKGQSYTVTATGLGQLDGYTFTLDQTGAHRTLMFKGLTLDPAPLCWWQRANDC